MKKSYIQSYMNVKRWHDQQMEYWNKYKGDLHNRPDHHQACFHNPASEDWWDFVRVNRRIEDDHPSLYHSQHGLKSFVDEIERRLVYGHPVVKPYKQGGWNRAPFGSWMKFKDILNDVLGTPTPVFKKNLPDEPETGFERLFDPRDEK